MFSVMGILTWVFENFFSIIFFIFLGVPFFLIFNVYKTELGLVFDVVDWIIKNMLSISFGFGLAIAIFLAISYLKNGKCSGCSGCNKDCDFKNDFKNNSE